MPCRRSCDGVRGYVVAVTGCGSTSSSSSSSSTDSPATSAAATSAAGSGDRQCDRDRLDLQLHRRGLVDHGDRSRNAHRVGEMDERPRRHQRPPGQGHCLDDALTASTSVQDAKQLVEQDHVVAIVGRAERPRRPVGQYAESKGVPVIGAAVYNTAYENNPDFFPTGAQNPTQVYGDVAEAKALGKTKIGLMYCAEAPSCAAYSALFNSIGKFVGGVSVVSNQKITATQPNYTAACLAAKSAGADALIILHASAIVTRVTADCAQQGYTPQQLNLSYTPGVAWAKDPNMQGLVQITPNQSLWDNSSPADPGVQPGDGHATRQGSREPGIQPVERFCVGSGGGLQARRRARQGGTERRPQPTC